MLALGALLVASVRGDAAVFGVLATSATLTMTSDAGAVGSGKTYHFATPETTFATSSATREVQIQIQGFDDGSWPGFNQYWFLDFDAPDGQQLTPGLYSNAGRRSFRPPELPGMDMSGIGQGCNTLTGSFNVLAADFGPYGYIEHFHATFEQFCDGSSAALRGEVDLHNPPAPAEIKPTIVVNSSAQLTKGSVQVRGTVACNRPPVNGLSYLQLTLSQAVKNQPPATGTGSIGIYDCSTTPTPWTIVVTSADPKKPLSKGQAAATVSAHIKDAYYDLETDTAPIQATVALKEG